MGNNNTKTMEMKQKPCRLL